MNKDKLVIHRLYLVAGAQLALMLFGALIVFGLLFGQVGVFVMDVLERVVPRNFLDATWLLCSTVCGVLVIIYFYYITFRYAGWKTAISMVLWLSLFIVLLAQFTLTGITSVVGLTCLVMWLLFGVARVLFNFVPNLCDAIPRWLQWFFLLITTGYFLLMSVFWVSLKIGWLSLNIGW